MKWTLLALKRVRSFWNYLPYSFQLALSFLLGAIFIDSLHLLVGTTSLGDLFDTVYFILIFLAGLQTALGVSRRILRRRLTIGFVSLFVLVLLIWLISLALAGDLPPQEFAFSAEMFLTVIVVSLLLTSLVFLGILSLQLFYHGDLFERSMYILSEGWWFVFRPSLVVPVLIFGLVISLVALWSVWNRLKDIETALGGTERLMCTRQATIEKVRPAIVRIDRLFG